MEEMLTKNFAKKELACPCCGECKMRPEFLEKLQQLRDSWNRPIIVNSGYRCADHNKKIGGEPNSQHMNGNAVDIHCLDSFERFGLLVRAISVGFRGIGLDKQYIHMDLRDGSAACWIYPLSISNT